MKATLSVLWRCTLLVGLCAMGCFPEQDPNADANSGSAGQASHAQGGKSPTATGAAGKASTQAAGGKKSAGSAGNPPEAEGSETGNPTPEGGSGGSGGNGYVETRQLVERCKPPDTSLALPQRDAVATNDAQTAEIPIVVNDLWTSFTTHCGHCHVDGASGNYKVTRNSFGTLVTQDVVDTYIKATNPVLAMPRGDEGAGADLGIDFSKRPAGDPIVALAASLSQWIAAGSPNDLFYVPNPEYGKESLYLMTADVAQGQSNLGSCVPDGNFTIGWGADRHKKMEDLDAMFAKARRLPPAAPGQPAVPANKQLGLPLHLSETDLITFDSQELARYGVVAFAPGYPLWSDNSGKLRYVRVPLGQSITYDKTTREFTIPRNTRFYKTFMKEVVDRGSQKKRYRKIETRIIVSRPDSSPGDPGALFGTYVWNEDETEATLLGYNAVTGENEVLRDLTPFPDKIISYYTDEPKADAIRFADPPPTNETYALEKAKVLRHYVLPGKERCRHCHMGSVRGDFVLGFTPMQISRRAQNEGGVLEAAYRDEILQLDRLTALGVITGVDSAADIPLLENSQGDRSPRNENELIAQGYLFGNCAHCHNPKGYATNSVPELEKMLNFWPSKDGGIFQFPLDRISPRTSRGAQGRGVPYITPSLYDLLPYGFNPVGKSDYAPKVFFDRSEDGGPTFDLAPWRSLIYRNTQSPFIYGDDLTIFPHMPLDTSGYDCRVSQILGNWMVSIPAVRVHPELVEDYITQDSSTVNAFPGDPKIDNEPQPYLEVTAQDPAYSNAVNAASQRVEAFHNGLRYGVCPSNDDVIDLSLAPEGPNVGLPADNLDPLDGVPDHTHFVATDLTESPGAWSPRGTTWNDILVKHVFPDKLDPTIKRLVSMLTDKGGITFDSKLKAFVSTPRPFAVWQKDPKCDFTKPPFSDHLATSYTGDNRPRWFDLAKLPDTAPIMDKLPGGNIYDMICINCHGPDMDSKGRQADTVQQLTGGGSRVANFMTGLFGPRSSPGTARGLADGFGSVVTSAVTADDWGGRYMSWMAMGGTTATIPRLVINLVARTPVAGVTRSLPLVNIGTASANMLEAAKVACKLVTGQALNSAADITAGNEKGVPLAFASYLLQGNGDAELWEHLCSINNPPFVRGLIVNGGGLQFDRSRLYESIGYPANTPVGKQGGLVVMSSPSGGVTDDNVVPWCVYPDRLTKQKSDALDSYLADKNNFINGQPPPLCPTVLTAATDDRLDEFALRGGLNAGFAIFYYLDQVSKGHASTARFDTCTQISTSH